MEVAFDRAVQDFLVYQKSKGNSQETLDYYSWVLGDFARYLARQGPGPLAPVGALTPDLLRGYVAHVLERRKLETNPRVTERAKQGHVSRETARSLVRGLKVFLRFCHREGYLDRDLAAAFSPPRARQKVVEVLEPQEVRALFAACDTKTHQGARAHALLALFLGTGLRLGEVSGLLVANVQLDGRWVKVLGKGNKERLVPFGPFVQRSLSRYFFHFRPAWKGTGEERFFLTLNGLPLTQGAISDIIKRLGVRAGVERLHPHLLRHTFATQYLVSGGDIFTLQVVLGHTSLEMVRRYSHLARQHVVARARAVDPLSQILQAM